MADEKEQQALATVLAEARRALKLKADEVFDAKLCGDELTLVTIGGHKVRYRSGAEVKPLHELHAGRSIKPPAPPKE